MEIKVNKNYSIKRLQKWLDYELSTSVLLILQYVHGIAFVFAVIASVIFTPIMLKSLLDEERYGWMIFFAIIVGLPITFLLLVVNSTWFDIVMYIPLGAFYFYCFLLRLAIKDW